MTAGLRQVGVLLGVFGAGLALVVLVVLVAPGALRITPAEPPDRAGAAAAAPADEIAVAWTDTDDSAAPDGDSPGADDADTRGEIVVEGERSVDDEARAGAVEPAPEAGSTGAAGRTGGGAGDGDGTSASGADTPTGDVGDPGAADAAGTAAARVLELVNAERAAAGCPALVADPSLDALAQGHSADMAERGYFDHTDPDGATPWDRAEAAGVDGLAAENIARGQADAEGVVRAWMDSPGHRANILSCSSTRHGLGVVHGAGGPWWTQVFGR